MVFKPYKPPTDGGYNAAQYALTDRRVHATVYYLHHEAPEKELSWTDQLIQEAAGYFHVCIEVYGQEFEFGAPSGLFIKTTTRSSGRGYTFKEAVLLGETKLDPEEVQLLYGSLLPQYGKADYDLVWHSCVDFSRTMAEKLGVSDLPAWCRRASDVGKLLISKPEEPRGENSAPHFLGAAERPVGGVEELSPRRKPQSSFSWWMC